MNIINNAFNGFTVVSDVKIPDIYFRRFKTGRDEVDEVFSKEGFIPGATFTLAAPAGSGKTSMLLQTLELLHQTGKKTAYISGEESVQQLAFTCKRLNVKNVSVANITNVEDIFDAVEHNKFDIIVLDSLPALRSREKISGKKLEEYLSNYICAKAKKLECVVGIILHMTKAGTYKGSTLLPHSVDCNILMKCNEIDRDVREFIVTKNRFGSICETAFRMTSTGFDFVKVDVDNLDENADSDTNNTDTKMSKSQTYKDILLEHIKKQGSIDIKTASSLLDCAVKAQYTLRNLTTENVLHKAGRGQHAIWTHVTL